MAERLIKRLAEGLDIISRQAGASVATEHDILYAGSSAPLSDEDKERLIALGWFWDAENDSWSIFT